ncbi:MAG TPA: bifunctional histidinol-phosphatase/imidazoleglycerol-phosphate dehydratase HisB [Chitinophaga sp.]|uniref:bifunctional histidinol-phosphatase/imidazoleglycerol-phosphate dehydratase HisB n=1 Tax=Chitinophaga sp. TaxID=1869181 RepID=UPI002DB756AC|nr:bifunctional histidinol-phosphatase/imidazoleglycerol-phosphate dehydratase HisB [Chitinophaga sp.]HEU4555952.1 bifunctional histidinol-phosphatase/imidazoleglycerol-phosphate dehydratase HisB [Chitinophaga sp.]
MKRILFIDRDGTLIKEVPPTYQVDSLEKIEYYPKVFTYMAKIAAELDYELVMVSNQDGMGTESFPEAHFWLVQNKIIQAFENEGVYFKAVHIDRTFPHENAPTRKPGTGMLTQYFSSDYDLANSFVIGDRITDVQLAKNLGAKAIWMNEGTGLGSAEIKDAVADLQPVIALESTDWGKIYEFLKLGLRTVTHKRTTKETDIAISLNLDGKGQASIETGLGFFDHMLEQIARHGNIDLTVKAIGDLHIDEHHTIEDTGLALGEAMAKALADKRGMERYGFCLPMDDCLAQVAIDFGGRNWLVWDAKFNREKIGEMPTEMFFHFFKSFSDAAKCNLNIRAEGENEHHKIEAIFKAFAKAVKMAVRRDPLNLQLPSTKGVL